jgi:ABC-type branched-subunit amino acid transport system permease subunit
VWGLAHDTGFFYVLAVAAALGCLAIVAVERSRLGRLLRALADSPTALMTAGANANITRVMVFCISAFLAGVSGALVGQTVGITNGDLFPAFNSIVLLAVLALQFAFTPFGTVGCALLASGSMVLLPAYVPDWLGIRPDTVTNYLGLLFGVGALAAGLTTRPRRGPVLHAAAERSMRRRAAAVTARRGRATRFTASPTTTT